MSSAPSACGSSTVQCMIPVCRFNFPLCLLMVIEMLKLFIFLHFPLQKVVSVPLKISRCHAKHSILLWGHQPSQQNI